MILQTIVNNRLLHRTLIIFLKLPHRCRAAAPPLLPEEDGDDELLLDVLGERTTIITTILKKISATAIENISQYTSTRTAVVYCV
jgi:hypothetical protein